MLNRFTVAREVKIRPELKTSAEKRHNTSSPSSRSLFFFFFARAASSKLILEFSHVSSEAGPPDSQSEEDTFASHGILNKLRRKSSLTMRKSSVRGAIFKVNGGETRQSECKMWILILNNYGRWAGPGWVKTMGFGVLEKSFSLNYRSMSNRLLQLSFMSAKINFE